jgi:ankyrin repeat protein
MSTLNDCLFNSAIGTAKQFLDNGAEINAKGENGIYPIVTAIASENPRVLDFVISNGADVNIDLGNGWTPLHEAFDSSIDGMIQNYQKRPTIESVEIINILICNGADIKKRNSQGRTPLDCMNSYCATRESFNFLKDIFREILQSIDVQVEFKKKAS